MSNQELVYEDYNDKSIAVRGDRDKFGKILKEVNGRWNPRMKGGAGWLVSKEFASDLKKIAEQLVGLTVLEVNDLGKLLKGSMKRGTFEAF